GLALINGTQFMSAYGMCSLIKSEKLLQWADVIAAISFDAFDGNIDLLNEKLHSIRDHEGQVSVAKTLRKLLEGSEIATQSKAKLQDPYSLRCIPQVHGATKDTFDFVLKTFLKEIN